MKYEDVISVLDKIAEPQLAESWDNCGIQLNIGNNDISNILFCLEINDDIIQEATDKSVDLIVTHHPLIFNHQHKIDVDTVTGKYIIKLIKSGISVFSLHTNFDKAKSGNNYYLAKLLNLNNIDWFDDDIGIMGFLPYEMEFKEAIEYIKEAFDLPENYIKAVGRESMIIDKVAICSGAGGDLIYRAFEEDCSMLITGDVKLNIAQDAKAMGISIVDAGHYGTEKFFSENIIEQFADIIKDNKEYDVNLILAKSNTNPYNIC